MAEESEKCPNCGALMVNIDQRMVVELKVIKILLRFRCEKCGTTVEYAAHLDRETLPWVKKTVYHGASLEFVYSEES